ncbi:MAG: hypothetical protein ACI85K_003751 [Hyphomicrobiaceae bacterium]|jgi:hypothetical protein
MLVIAAGILWLVGQGFGWFGSGPSGEQGVGDGLARGAVPAAVAGSGLPAKSGEKSSLPSAEARVDAPPPPLTQLAGTQSHGGTPAAGQPVAGKVKGARGAAASPSTSGAASLSSTDVIAGGDKDRSSAAAATVASQPQRVARVSADRFASLMSLLESHLSASELGHAAGAMQRLLKQPLSDAQRAHVAGVEARLLPLQKACEARILEFVQSGEVLAADREAAQLVVGGVWRATELLAAAPKLALASNWQDSIDSEVAAVPAPSPLMRNRKVRVHFHDELRTGVVASSNREEVTVRLVSDGSQTFPTVKAIACEPADSSSSEAVEMGFAAVHAGAPRLARLWMLRAHLLKDELTTRGQQLLALLR